MAGETDSYDGRKPSFNIEGRVRGFRSKPGAPQSNPALNIGAIGGSAGARDSRGFTSNWDSIFRNTAANDFGAAGKNPKYFSSFPDAPAAPTGVAGPVGSTGEEDQADIFAPGVTRPSSPVAPTNFSGSAPTHAQQWSAPPPRRADDSMPGKPWMPMGPGAKMVMPKMASTWNALLAQNKALVAPGGMSGMLQGPKTYDQGWQKTSDAEREDIGRQFGWKSSFQ